MRTQVAIIGAGPAGLLLSQLLHVSGIDSVILERKDRTYVEARIRAGVLEQTTVELMREAGVAARLEREGLVHHGIEIALDGKRHKLDFPELTGGKTVTVYGQTEVVKDLIAARLSTGGDVRFEVEDVSIHDFETDRPKVRYRQGDVAHEIDCDVIAGCDGFHGICRASLPEDALTIYEKVYPFAWLGILAHVEPPAEDLIYARHKRGFALFSMRSRQISRHYLQCVPEENLDEWPDERIWDELALRLGDREILKRGKIVDKSVTPMRSFVAEPLRHGRLLLAGDAGHIVPPTGAKGLNLAASDVHYLYEALKRLFKSGDASGLDTYSDRALARVWKAQRFSWWLTSMLHKFAGTETFENRVHLADLEYVLSSRAALTALAENYVGLPF